jgi:superfamily II DNA helicase RecQ
MSLQYKFFRVPVKSMELWEDEINRFLRSVKVVHIERKFIDQGENSFWAMAIEYLSGVAGPQAGMDPRKRAKVDYKELLSPEDFSVFVNLREWRKSVASQEGVPVYVIFTNEQLAQIAEKRVVTLADLEKIEGIGESRIAKYGKEIIKIVSNTAPGAYEKREE